MGFKRGDCVVDAGKHKIETQSGVTVEGAEINFGRGVVLESSPKVMADGAEPMVKVYFDNYKLGPLKFPEAALQLDEGKDGE